MSDMEQKTAIVIGGGFAGLAAAVFLDPLGYKVTVLEKKPILGGRTYAFKDKKTDTMVDNGQHMLMGAYHETISFLENIGAKRFLSEFGSTHVALLDENGKSIPFSPPDLPAPFNFLGALFGFQGMTFQDKWGCLKMGFELMALKKNLKHKNTQDKTVLEWLKEMGQSDTAIMRFWEILTLATLNDTPDKASALMLAQVLIKGFMGSKSDGTLIIPQGDLNELLVKPATEYLDIRGHDIYTKKGVKTIHLLNNKVQCVELDDGTSLKADLYISSVPPRVLNNLIPPTYREGFPYFSPLKHIKYSPIVSINLWFNESPFDEPYIGVAEKKIHWYFNKNIIHHKPEGPFHIMAVKSGAYDFLDLSKEEILNITLSEMGSIFPKMNNLELLHSLINQEREATMSITPKDYSLRVSQKTPFENFFVIGDWTQTELPATIESAVVSARLAADMILAKDKPETHTPDPQPEIEHRPIDYTV